MARDCLCALLLSLTTLPRSPRTLQTAPRTSDMHGQPASSSALTPASILDLEPRMESLLALRSERLPFLHPTWLRTWLAEFGGNVEPLFLTAGDGSCIGVAPLMRADDCLTFIGDHNICDFMDVLVDPARAGEAYEQLWRHLVAEEWTDMTLWGLMAESPTLGDLAGRGLRRGV